MVTPAHLSPPELSATVREVLTVVRRRGLTDGQLVTTLTAILHSLTRTTPKMTWVVQANAQWLLDEVARSGN